VTQPPPVRPEGLRLGLRANLAQFCLLVGVNALVGGMVGQERSLLSLLATEVFGLAAVSAALTYIVAFGLTKAATNFLAGALADRYGRKPVLVAGWLVGLPVPLLIIWAPTWSWIVAANVLLGLNQGLCWSTTVIMKIDLAGPRRRGLAMGLNEAAGYLAVAVTAYLTGLIAARAGLRPEPFYLGLAYAGLGLGLSALLVRETRGHADLEAQLADADQPAGRNTTPNQPPAASRPPARSWSPRAGGSRPCPPAARPGWSTTSTTAWPGGCCPCCLSAAASPSARSACWRRCIRPCGAWASSSPAPCPTGWAASPSSPAACCSRPSRWPAQR
jgi:MFS family permease